MIECLRTILDEFDSINSKFTESYKYETIFKFFNIAKDYPDNIKNYP